MSLNRKGAPGSDEAAPTGRRLFIFRATAFLTASTGALVAGGFVPARAQVTDQDPTDPEGRGRGGSRGGAGGRTGLTDCDPNDRENQGNGRRPRTGVTDQDSGPQADPQNCGRRGRTEPPRTNTPDPADPRDALLQRRGQLRANVLRLLGVAQGNLAAATLDSEQTAWTGAINRSLAAPSRSARPRPSYRDAGIDRARLDDMERRINGLRATYNLR